MNGGKAIVPASYSHKYRLSTVAEKNSKGSWFGWKIDLVGQVEEINLYNTAKEFAKSTTASEMPSTRPTEESF